MEEIKLFKNSNFGNLRTIMFDDEPWFVGKDVAVILGYSNTKKALADHVDSEDKTYGVTIRDPIGRPQNPVLINESGLYSLILGSRKPSAHAFKHWVTHDVLPAIRRTGVYVTPSLSQQILSDPTSLDLILSQLRQERAGRLEAECDAQHLRNQLTAAQNRIAGLAPRPVFVFDGDPDAQCCCSVGDLAKQLSTTRKHVTRQKLFAALRRRGYIQSDSPLPTTYAIESGYFLIMEKHSGHHRYYTAAVTLPGQLYFASLVD